MHPRSDAASIPPASAPGELPPRHVHAQLVRDAPWGALPEAVPCQTRRGPARTAEERMMMILHARPPSGPSRDADEHSGPLALVV